MKQDYLWDKTGSDAEIEGFENALAAFRCKETAAPVIQPAKIIPFKKELPRRSFRLAYAIAACAAFAMIGWSAWYQFQGSQIEFQDGLAQTIQPEIPKAQPEVSVAVKTDNLPDAKIEIHKQIPARKFVKVNKTASLEIPQKAQKIKDVKPKSGDAELTKEEKYAYNQLMLALSITSSKLKMVKDTVEGAPEETMVVEKGR